MNPIFERKKVLPVSTLFSSFLKNGRSVKTLVQFPTAMGGVAINEVEWFAFSDQELLQNVLTENCGQNNRWAVEDQKRYFSILCGMDRPRFFPAERFVTAAIEIDLRLCGWKRVKARIKSLRKAYCKYWRDNFNLELVSNDDYVSNYYNDSLIDKCLDAIKTYAVAEGFTYDASEGPPPLSELCKFIGADKAKEICKSESIQHYGPFQQTGLREKVLEVVTEIYLNFESFFIKSGRTTWPADLGSFKPGALPLNPGRDPTYRRIRDLAKRYCKAVRNLSLAKSPAATPGDYHGEAVFTINKTRLKMVEVKGEPLAPEFLKGNVKELFDSQVNSIRNDFEEYAKNTRQKTPSYVNHDAFIRYGFIHELLGGIEHLQSPDFSILSPEQYTWFQDLCAKSNIQQTPEQALAFNDFFYRMVKKYSEAVDFNTGFGGRLCRTASPPFEHTVAISRQHWDTVETNALINLEFLKKREIPLRWNPRKNRESYFEQYFKMGFQTDANEKKLTAGPWFDVLDDTYMRGVVFLEGCMRAYLRGSGFASKSPPDSGYSSEFFDEIRGGLAAAPPWRWILLREAYLAALIWAWSEFLFGRWGPFSTRSLVDYKAAFGFIGMDVMCAVHKSSSPFSGNAFMPVMNNRLGDLSAFSTPIFGEYCYKQNHLNPGYALSPDSHANDPERPSHFGLNLLGVNPEAIKLGNNPPLEPREHSSEDHKLDVGIPDTLPNQPKARALQLIGSWLIAGHVRHATAAHANRIRDRVTKYSKSKAELAAWMPVGTMNLDQWVSAPGLVALFTIPDFFWNSPATPPPDFSTWIAGGDDSIRTNWQAIESAPLSFSFLNVNLNKNYDRSEQMSSVYWFDRTLRAIGQNLDPVTLTPLNDFLPGIADHADFRRWRERIWSPLTNLDRGAVKQSDTSIETRQLKPKVLALWQAWMKSQLPGGDPKGGSDHSDQPAP